MNKIFLISVCLANFVLADVKKDLEIVERDLVKTGLDVWVLVSDAGTCLVNNIPSASTLTIDGSVDGVLRQFKPAANMIKQLEDKNPVNGAIVRDFSKTMTVLFKIHYELPVDLSGRLYDRVDLYSQAFKLVSKTLGFSGLYACGYIGNSVLLFVVNNGGDILSQAVLDSGKAWRKNQTVSFEDFALENYSPKNAFVSIPAKGAMSYVVGWVIQTFSIADAAEIAMLVILNQVEKTKTAESMSLQVPKNLPFMPGFMTSAVTSIVKSLILTTTCKTAVDLTNSFTGWVWKFVPSFSEPNSTGDL